MQNTISDMEIRTGLDSVRRWVIEHGYKGYEPFDGLSSVFRPMTLGNIFMDRVLMQLVRRSPINIRPLLGIKPLDSTVGRGYMAWGDLLMYRATGEQSFVETARENLQWLIDNPSPGYAEFSWGKHFDFASRGGRYPALEPITIWTSLVGMAFLEAYETLGEEKYLDVADSVCRWISSLSRNVTDRGICLSYTATGEDGSTIHNHSMMGGAMLARTAKHTGNRDYFALAKLVMEYSCVRQLDGGSWWYGEDPKFHWIDNFHTGYNLDALKCYIESSGDTDFKENLLKGLEFYVDNFFEESGRPKYYHNNTYPVDSQCISQSIDTLAGFVEENELAGPLARKVATWAVSKMQGPDGRFFFRQYRYGKVKTPMLHWAQATTYKGLAHLLLHSSTG